MKFWESEDCTVLSVLRQFSQYFAPIIVFKALDLNYFSVMLSIIAAIWTLFQQKVEFTECLVASWFYFLVSSFQVLFSISIHHSEALTDLLPYFQTVTFNFYSHFLSIQLKCQNRNIVPCVQKRLIELENAQANINCKFQRIL